MTNNILIPGKLYKTKTKIWYEKSWLDSGAVFLFVKKEKENERWSTYFFIHKEKLKNFEYRIDDIQVIYDILELK